MDEIKSTNLPAIGFFGYDLRVGQIMQVESVPKSKKLLKLEVNFGAVIGNRVIMAGIGGNSPYGEIVDGVWKDSCLVGQKIVAVLNLEPREMMGVMSYGMLLATHNEDGKIHLITSFAVPNGSEVG